MQSDQQAKQDELKKLCQYNAFIWAAVNNIEIMDNVKFTMVNTRYLKDCIDFRTPRNPRGKFDSLVIKKGAQSRITTSMMLYVLHALKYQVFEKNVMYFMPTFTSVQRANSLIFTPLLNNRCVRPFVQDNNIDLKKIAGHSIVFVGAQPKKMFNTEEKDSSNARSIPCDMVLWDELDHIDDDIKEQGFERMLDSKIALEAAWGSPTIPGYGVDYRYENSSRDKWQIKCGSCGKYTCLIDEFPRSIDKKGGKWTRVCVHCNAEIFVNDGKWVSEVKESDVCGKFISGLMAPRAKFAKYMKIWHSGTERQRVHMERSFLGRAVMQSGSQLLEYQILERCQDYHMPSGSKEETVCGVDVNDMLNVVIGQRIGEDMYRILWVSEVKDFEELAVWCDNFNVNKCFIDSMPDMHATRQFVKDMHFPVYRTTYSEFCIEPNIDRPQHKATVNRNECCDMVHDTFARGKIDLPKENQLIRGYAKSMTKIAKTIVETAGSSVAKPRWVKIGDKQDHYFHATLYFLLAAKHSPIASGRYGGSRNAVVLPRVRRVGTGTGQSGGIYVPSRAM